MYSLLNKHFKWLIINKMATLRAYSSITRAEIEANYKDVKRFPNFVNGVMSQSTADAWYPVHNPVPI